MVTETEILKALERVTGPDGQTPLPQTGMLVGLSIKDGKVFASLAIEAKDAAKIEPLRRTVETIIKKLPGVTGALVSLTAERPAGAAAHDHSHHGHSHGHAHSHAHPAPTASASPSATPGPRATAARASTEIPGIQKIIAVASGKGGVGKSTLSANLALALVQAGHKVGLLDADIYGPSVPRLFGIQDKPKVVGKLMIPHEAHGLKLMSIGFLVEEATAMIWRGPMIMSALNQMLREVAWGELDYLIVDMPPGTGDAQLSMAQGVQLAGAVIVSTPQDLALIDARRGIAMFQKVNVPVLGIVENMSYFLCPHCGGRSDIFAHGGARHEAETMGVPFLGEIPLALAIRELSDAGRPIVATDPTNPHAQAFAGVARNLEASLASGGKTKPAPLFVVEN